ncbi:MAG: hypothetical protein IIY93_01735 [Clostridia bacterium]|nr:hypothetical protein [Clostridia bacterium]
MAMQYGFFDAVESNGSYDRVYGAAFFTHFINAYFCSAVPDGCFTVTKNSGLTLNVGSGHGIVGGVYFYDDSASTLSVTPATGTRNDLVVARLNAAARTVTLEVKQNTSSAADNEVALAIITVNGSTVTQVTQVSYSQILRGAVGSGDSVSSGNSSSSGSSSSGSGTSASSSSSGTTTGMLTSKVSSTASSPTVYYSARHTTTRSGSNVTVALTFAGWLGSSGSKLGTGVKLTVYARINGGAWKSVVLKKTSDSWSGTTQHTASLNLSAATTAKTAAVEFYVTRSGSTYSGSAGTLGSASAPKSYSVTLP